MNVYQDWEKKVDCLVNALLEKDILLRQYAIWLETSEEHTRFKGEDMYHRLEGVLQGLSDVDFIPGIDSMNFIAVVGEVQKKTGLDLGICQYLQDNIKEYKKFQYGGDTDIFFHRCKIKKDMIIVALKNCLPPERSKCEYRCNNKI